MQKRTTVAKSKKMSSKICPKFCKGRPWESKWHSGRLWVRFRCPRRPKMGPRVSKMTQRDTKKTPKTPQMVSRRSKINDIHSNSMRLNEIEWTSMESDAVDSQIQQIRAKWMTSTTNYWNWMHPCIQTSKHLNIDPRGRRQRR